MAWASDFSRSSPSSHEEEDGSCEELFRFPEVKKGMTRAEDMSHESQASSGELPPCVIGNEWGIVGLGKGGYNFSGWLSDSVGTARRQTDGGMVAVRFVSFSDDKKRRSTIQREVEMLRSFQHEAVMRLEAAYVSKFDAWFCFEYCAGGSVEDFVRGRGALAKNQVYAFTRQLAQGVTYLRSCGALHRNIMCSNLLLSADQEVLKLGDFKHVFCFEDAFEITPCSASYSCYTAPEVVLEQRWTPAADIWSCGMCTLFMLRAALPLPFDSWDKQHLEESQGREGEWQALLQLEGVRSASLRAFLEVSLAQQPDGRQIALELATKWPWRASTERKEVMTATAASLQDDMDGVD